MIRSTIGYKRTTENNNPRAKKRSLSGVVLGASLRSHGELKSCFDLAVARGVCCGCATAAALFICFGGYLID
jgi:hypothetical protein